MQHLGVEGLQLCALCADVTQHPRECADLTARFGPAGVRIQRAVEQTASSVFESANRARLAGDRPLAVARYEQILASWPRSPEAAQTRATLGRLMLDRGDPSSALEHLEAYLAGPDTTVREEVLGARAQALMHLGRSADEVRAWNELLAEYPLSIHAKRAHARLERLTAAP